MTAHRRILGLGAATALAALALGAFSASAQVAQAQRFGTHYQQLSSLTCDSPDSTPCTIPFSTMDRGYLKVLKASCTIQTSEGGSPSREVTGAVLGRLSSNKSTFVPGQFLAPIQTEFAGPGQIVLNFLIDTLWVVPQGFRPAIQVQRLNGPPIVATCSIAGEETVPS